MSPLNKHSSLYHIFNYLANSIRWQEKKRLETDIVYKWLFNNLIIRLWVTESFKCELVLEFKKEKKNFNSKKKNTFYKKTEEPINAFVKFLFEQILRIIHTLQFYFTSQTQIKLSEQEDYNQNSTPVWLLCGLVLRRNEK